MTVTCEIDDYSNPSKPRIRIHSVWSVGEHVELEINGECYEVNGKELKSAVDKCILDSFGR